MLQALTAAGVDIGKERQRETLRLPTTKDAYLVGGEFDRQAMLDFNRQAEAEALKDGFSGLRLAGEMTWALGPEPGCDRLIEYEALLNHWVANSHTVVLCLYSQSRFDAPCIHDVLRTHPLAFLGDQVCTNPHYEPPELVLSPEMQASAEFERKRVAWWIVRLKQARAAEQERERALEKLKQSERRLAEAHRLHTSAAGNEICEPTKSPGPMNCAACSASNRTLATSPTSSSWTAAGSFSTCCRRVSSEFATTGCYLTAIVGRSWRSAASCSVPRHRPRS